jgi:hypothetical protein
MKSLQKQPNISGKFTLLKQNNDRQEVTFPKKLSKNWTHILPSSYKERSNDISALSTNTTIETGLPRKQPIQTSSQSSKKQSWILYSSSMLSTVLPKTLEHKQKQ